MTALHYTVTPEDYVAFCLQQARRPDLVRRHRIMVTLLMLGIAFLPALLPWWLGNEPFKAVWPRLPTMLILAVLLQVIMHPIAAWLRRAGVRRAALALLGRSPSGTFLGPHRMWTSPEGMHFQGTQSESRIAWSAVTGLAETPDHLFVLIGPAQSVILPKRGQNPADVAGFRAAVQAHLPPAAG